MTIVAEGSCRCRRSCCELPMACGCVVEEASAVALLLVVMVTVSKSNDR
jgi:hypothetical protein